MTAEVQQLDPGWSIPPISDGEFNRFRDLIHAQTGIKLGDHKRHLLVARLAQRLRRYDMRSFSDYYEHVADDESGDELRELINHITTNVTSFFREPHHFDFLRAQVLPRVKEIGCALKVWSAASSSGEEPYSIAITAFEELGPLSARHVRILASDIDTSMLDHARAATYSLESLRQLSKQRLRANFLRGYGEFDGLAMVRPAIRKLVDFQRINLIEPTWPVQEGFDLIFCRNVIIYFDQPTQRRIIERLTGCLKPGGYFFSGHSESLHWARDLLTLVQPTIYRRIGGGSQTE